MQLTKLNIRELKDLAQDMGLSLPFKFRTRDEIAAFISENFHPMPGKLPPTTAEYGD